MGIDQEQNLEIYRQRYETWRHLDARRLQLTQFVVAAFSLLLVALTSQIALPNSVILSSSALVLLLSYGALRQINLGILANGKALKTYGELVGDKLIPDVSNRSLSMFYIIEIALLISGATSAVVAIYEFTIGLK